LRLKPTPIAEELNLISANRSPIRSLGTVEVQLAIQGLVIPCTMHVLQSLSHQVLLGQDFLKSSNAIINCGSRYITLFDGLVSAVLTRYNDRDSILTLAHDVVIPPTTEALVKLFVPRRYQNRTNVL
jgi:hypothetical protein